MVMTAGKKDVQVVLVSQTEGAVRDPRSVQHLQPPVFNLHTNWMQRFSTTLPLVRCSQEPNKKINTVRYRAI